MAQGTDKEIPMEDLERALTELETAASPLSKACDDNKLEAKKDEEDEDKKEVKAEAVEKSEAPAAEEVVAEAAVEKSTEAEVAVEAATEEVADQDYELEVSAEADVEKSVDLYEDETLVKAIEISPFLEALVEKVSDSLNGLNKSLSERNAVSKSTEQALAKAFRTLGKAVKALDSRLAALEAKPAVVKVEAPAAAPTAALSKGVKSVQDVQVLERSFEGAGKKSDQPTVSLTKSVVADHITALAIEGKVSDLDITRFESVGAMSPSVQALVMERVKASATK